jgi:hypothetical protein
LTKRSTSEFRLGATVVNDQSDWETKNFPAGELCGEKYGWMLRQSARKGSADKASVRRRALFCVRVQMR